MPRESGLRSENSSEAGLTGGRWGINIWGTYETGTHVHRTRYTVRWYRANSGQANNPLSSRYSAKHRRGGGSEVVCVSRVEGRTGAPTRGAPVITTAHKVCACESQPRTLLQQLLLCWLHSHRHWLHSLAHRHVVDADRTANELVLLHGRHDVALHPHRARAVLSDTRY